MVRAKLPKITEELFTKYSQIAFKATDCRDYARIDYRLSAKNEIFLLEINHNPGIGPNTHGLNNTLTMMADFLSVSFEQLITRIVEIARRRYTSI
jgi:D-alanine-D-alanine ligase